MPGVFITTGGRADGRRETGTWFAKSAIHSMTMGLYGVWLI